MGSILDEKYSVTHVASNAAWYIPCVRCSRCGASAGSVGQRIGWVVGWVFERGFSGCGF